MTLSDCTRYFKWLDDLRASAVINMYGAAPLLRQEFGLAMSEARDICTKWRNTFDGNTTAKARAAKAVKA
jgi:hypothetical protein